MNKATTIEEMVENVIKANCYWLWEKLHKQEKEDLVNQLSLLVKRGNWTKDVELEKRITGKFNQVLCAVIKTYGKDDQIELSEQSFLSQTGNETIEKYQSDAMGKVYFRIVKL